MEASAHQSSLPKPSAAERRLLRQLWCVCTVLCLLGAICITSVLAACCQNATEPSKPRGDPTRRAERRLHLLHALGATHRNKCSVLNPFLALALHQNYIQTRWKRLRHRPTPPRQETSVLNPVLTNGDQHAMACRSRTGRASGGTAARCRTLEPRCWGPQQPGARLFSPTRSRAMGVAAWMRRTGGATGRRGGAGAAGPEGTPPTGAGPATPGAGCCRCCRAGTRAAC